MPHPEPFQTWKKYDEYNVVVDTKQGDRSTELKLLSFKRPHMRAFWISTLSFFFAFVSWFSFAPLMPEVKLNLDLSTHDEYNANIASVTATVIGRIMIGPICDTFGARKAFALLLFLGSIPTFLSGMVETASELALIRFFVGFLGATFVCNQAWTSQMFAKEIVGIANATSAGWGNLGGGVTHLLMIALWHGFRLVMNSETAWRVSFVIPALLTLICSFATFFLADDAPKGQFRDLIAHGVMVRKSAKASAKLAYHNFNSWILALNYGVCFGIELVVFNVATTYFHGKFDLSTTKASLIATLFGFLNIFSRTMGGALSDHMFRSYGGGFTGMRGRLYAHFFCLICEAISIIVFSRMNSLPGAIVVLIFFSLGVQMSNGTTYAIVPYVCPIATGAVSGITAAGGNIGAILWGLIFRFQSSAETSFFILGFIVLVAAFFVPLISIRGHDGLLHDAEGIPASTDTI